MPCRALLCCLSLAAAQQRRELKAKAWFGKSNNRKQSVPLEQHDGADASEPYLVHDVEATKKTAITHDRFHGLYPCQIGTPCPSYSAAFLASLSADELDGRFESLSSSSMVRLTETFG